MNDVRQWIFGAIIGLFACVGLMLSVVYVSSCGFSFTCNSGAPLVVRTPIPTLIPVAHTEGQGSEQAPEFNACLVSAADLIGAWVTAGSPEAEAFPFVDVNGDPCEGTFTKDVQHLFVENSTWYTGQLGCVSCHNAQQTERNAGLDLTSYQGIIAGAQNKDILGKGNWESSVLHDVLLVKGLGPTGHSPDTEPVAPVFVYAGQHVDETSLTPTATP